jgi:streptomycin 6-kinase
MPEVLRRAVARDPDPGRRAWFAALPGTVDGLARRWDLTVGRPFQPGGECSWVAPARDATGRDVVLKVGWTHADALHEAAGLRLWAGRSAVELLDEHVDGPTTALLLERATPGTTLAALPGPEQDVVIADVLRAAWREPPADHPFRTLARMCETWATGYEPPPTLDPDLAREGIELYRTLAHDPGPQLVLVTDLHAGNVLAAHRELWLLIDPKPHVGDPHYDVTQHLLNCPDRLRADPLAAVHRMAALLDLDADRVRSWLFARAVQDVHDFPWLAAVAPRLTP